MSRENVEIVRRAAEVFTAGDLDRYLSEFIAPEIEWVTSEEDPDAATHRGRESFRRYIEQWMESFEGLRAEVEEWIDVGDDRVLAWARWTGRGRTSGVGADWHLAIIYTVRDGRIVPGEEYFERQQALKAVGLEE
jgi:ketosteroid isomerase-like protein